MLAKVVKIGEEDLLVLWGLHNQPRALDAARLVVLCQECLGVAFLCPLTVGQAKFERPLPVPG